MDLEQILANYGLPGLAIFVLITLAFLFGQAWAKHFNRQSESEARRNEIDLKAQEMAQEIARSRLSRTDQLEAEQRAVLKNVAEMQIEILQLKHRNLERDRENEELKQERDALSIAMGNIPALRSQLELLEHKMIQVTSENTRLIEMLHTKELAIQAKDAEIEKLRLECQAKIEENARLLVELATFKTGTNPIVAPGNDKAKD